MLELFHYVNKNAFVDAIEYIEHIILSVTVRKIQTKKYFTLFGVLVSRLQCPDQMTQRSQ